MANYNRVILAGNLTRDPETRTTQSGISVTNFGLAVNDKRSQNNDVDFFDITVWREAGETIARYLGKGDPILVEGKLKTRTFEKDGVRQQRTSVVVDTFQFLGGGSTNGSSRKSDEEDFDDIPF